MVPTSYHRVLALLVSKVEHRCDPFLAFSDRTATVLRHAIVHRAALVEAVAKEERLTALGHDAEPRAREERGAAPCRRTAVGQTGRNAVTALVGLAMALSVAVRCVVVTNVAVEVGKYRARGRRDVLVPRELCQQEQTAPHARDGQPLVLRVGA
eukprot:6190156-Pleurochrysis_carterae.AAC.2